MAETVRFELTRALRLKGLAIPRNGPLCDVSYAGGKGFEPLVSFPTEV